METEASTVRTTEARPFDEAAYEAFASMKSFDHSLKYPLDFYERFVREAPPCGKHSFLFRLVKRAFDIFASAVGLLLLVLPFLVIAAAIKLDSRGPVFFLNERVGKGGKVFRCVKFRSMSDEAPHDVATSLFTDSGSYITKVGRFLRKTSLDELPQLFNVLIGQMSIVGYRPLVTSEKQCNEMRAALGVFSTRPGITGYAQVVGRDDVYYRNKAMLDAKYVREASIGWDIRLLFDTARVVLTHKGNRD